MISASCAKVSNLHYAYSVHKMASEWASYQNIGMIMEGSLTYIFYVDSF